MLALKITIAMGLVGCLTSLAVAQQTEPAASEADKVCTPETLVGRYVITGFGPGTGNTIVDIEYGYDRNGIVEVSATDRTTARPLLVTIDAAPRDPRRGSTHGQ